MGDEDTVVLTPEEKDKILNDVSEEEQDEEEKEEDQS
jgi:regulator of RNase E activity RraA